MTKRPSKNQLTLFDPIEGTIAEIRRRDPEELDQAAKESLELIDKAITGHKATKVFGLLSGGFDSLTATHIASHHPNFAGVIHINTGIGIPETNQYVRDVCETEGWHLYELHPPLKYEQLIVRYGFPGPPAHPMMYSWLKERPLRVFIREQKQGPRDHLVLCTGVRTQESKIRMGRVEPLNQDGAKVWTAVIHNWTAADVLSYVEGNNLPQNPVKQRLHISGECLCGCFSGPNERKEIEAWYPETAHQLQHYEAIVQLAHSLQLPGCEIPKGSTYWAPRQIESAEDSAPLPMCHYCRGARADALGE